MAGIEPNTFFGYLMALIGLGGGGTAALKLHTTQSEHGARINALEGRQGKHAEKLDSIHDTVARLDERSERAEVDRQEMLRLLRERRDG